MNRLMALPSIALILISLFSGSSDIPLPSGSAAPDMTAKCKFTVSDNSDTAIKLHDGKRNTAWTSSSGASSYIQISLPGGQKAAGVYITWAEVPKHWQLLESSGGSAWSNVSLAGRESFVIAYIPVDSSARALRIAPAGDDWTLSVSEIKVFGKGTLPSDVQLWQPSPAKADLMVIPAHPDDEFIYLGGTIPYYAGQQKKHTVVVYMTSSPMIRKFEALDGLWKVGIREYPVFLPLANKYSSTVEQAEADWGGLDNAVSLLVEQIRRFKPDVVVTHDLNGEYGHGAHKLAALATEHAVDCGADALQYPGSAEQYGTWQVKKCYLHLYPKNKIEMNWEEPLSAYAGKTALEVAKEGYAMHASQHFRDRPVLDRGPYDNAAFGLYYSAVGPDRKGGDFFENIDSPAPETDAPAGPMDSSSNASPTPQKTQKAGPKPTKQDTPALSIQIVHPGIGGIAAVIAVALLLLSITAYAANSYRVTQKARHAARKK